MIDIRCASLTSQGVQNRVFYLDGHPSRYQPRPTGLNFGGQTGIGVFPLVIAVPPVAVSNPCRTTSQSLKKKPRKKCCLCNYSQRLDFRVFSEKDPKPKAPSDKTSVFIKEEGRYRTHTPDAKSRPQSSRRRGLSCSLRQ